MKKMNSTLNFLKGLFLTGMMLGLIQCLSTGNETVSDPGDDTGDTPTETISTLPEGVGLSAVLNGTAVIVSDNDLNIYIIENETIRTSITDDHTIDTADLPISIGLIGTFGSSDTISVSLELGSENITSIISTGIAYTFTGTGTSLGYVYLFPYGGAATADTTFTIKSVSILFSTLEVQHQGNVVGSLELGFDNSSDVLTANFDGQFSGAIY